MTPTAIARLGAVAFAGGVAVLSLTIGHLVAGLALCTIGVALMSRWKPAKPASPFDDAYFVDRQGREYRTGSNYVEELLDRLKP